MRSSGDSGWLLVVLGAVILVAGLLSILAGRISQSGGRKWGIPRNYYVDRDESPIQFWFLIFLQVAIGIAVLCWGLTKVAG